MGTINLSTELCALRRIKRVKIDQKMPETCLRKDKQFKQLFNAQNTICAAPKSFLSLSKYYFQKNVNWRKDKKYCQFIVCTHLGRSPLDIFTLFTLRSQLTLCSQISYVVLNGPISTTHGKGVKMDQVHTVIGVFKYIGPGLALM